MAGCTWGYQCCCCCCCCCVYLSDINYSLHTRSWRAVGSLLSVPVCPCINAFIIILHQVINIYYLKNFLYFHSLLTRKYITLVYIQYSPYIHSSSSYSFGKHRAHVRHSSTKFDILSWNSWREDILQIYKLRIRNLVFYIGNVRLNFSQHVLLSREGILYLWFDRVC